MIRLATIGAILAAFTLGFLYVGSTHRDRCMKAGESGCTILPWSGHQSYVLGWGAQR